MLINPYLFLVATAGSTWNPSDKAATIVLSNSNMTAVVSANPSSESVRGTVGKSSGKSYFELYANSITKNEYLGIANSSYPIGGYYLGQDANGWGCTASGTKVNNSTFASTGVTFASGDVIGIALDMGAGKVWWSKNNVWFSGDPATGTSPLFTGLSGTIFPAVSEYASTAEITLRTTAAQQTYMPPSGFTAWG